MHAERKREVLELVRRARLGRGQAASGRRPPDTLGRQRQPLEVQLERTRVVVKSPWGHHGDTTDKLAESECRTSAGEGPSKTLESPRGSGGGSTAPGVTLIEI
jgi:hypothetical protein